MSLQIFILCMIIVGEFFFIVTVKFLRKDFKWLITSDDEQPNFNTKELESFFSKSYDPTLGWVRKFFSIGIENGEQGKIYFKTDEVGSRINSNSSKYVPSISCFGDSYAFCRQVDNDETWEYFLSDFFNTGVLNFGVGNYGFDQALIRYKNIKLPEYVDTVIMGVVPETICRIQSYWKHYLEFGNVFAFKPKFRLQKGSLNLQKNPMQNEKDFFHYHEKIPHIQRNDRFYKEKFKKFQFRFPYSISFLRNFNRNTKLFYALIRRSIKRFLGKSDSSTENLPFLLIMENNIQISHALYREKYSKDLFSALLKDFTNHAISNNHNPIFILLPQLVDCNIIKKTNQNPFSEFIRELNISNLKIIDFTMLFPKLENLTDYYVNDEYGGHLSKKGNRYVADVLRSELNITLGKRNDENNLKGLYKKQSIS